LGYFVDDLVVGGFLIVAEIHLVDCDDHFVNAERAAQEDVFLGLGRAPSSAATTRTAW
jgi:hypothetical protein